MPMSNTPFDSECERIVRLVDPNFAMQSEWRRASGEAHAKAVELIEAAISRRADLVLEVQPSPYDERHFLLKTASDRPILILKLKTRDDRITVWGETAPNSPLRLLNHPPAHTTEAKLGGAWVENTLSEIFARANN